MARVNRRTTPAVVAAVVAITAAACGGERSYDNPPEVPIGTASSTTSTRRRRRTTVFVPSTAPTTLAPPTNPPPPTAGTDVRPADGAADTADDPDVAGADDRRAVHGRPGRHAVRHLPQAQRAAAGPAGGERAQRELADRPRPAAQRPPGRVRAGRPRRRHRSRAPPAATAAPPATTAGSGPTGGTGAGTDAGTGAAADDDVRRAGRRRRPAGDVGVVPGAELDGGRRHADRVRAGQRARPQPGDGVAVRRGEHAVADVHVRRRRPTSRRSG